MEETRLSRREALANLGEAAYRRAMAIAKSGCAEPNEKGVA